MFYVVLFAMVAGFLAFRLYAVLGKRTGHEQPLPKPADERVVTLPAARPIDTVPEVRESGVRTIETGAETGLRAVISGDPSFDVTRFLEGAKGAYRVILEAFWRGDDAALEGLVSDEIREAFATAIAERTTAGHVLDNRLIAIDRAVIADAAVESRIARVSVRFDADIAAVTRDAEGNVIAGSLSDAVVTHDIWTFARGLRSDDPNWKLVETDEA